MSVGPRFRKFSDIIRDGLGIELLNEESKVVAEVFRYDGNNTLTVSLFQTDLPCTHIEKMISVARSELGEFENGKALPPPIQ